MPTLPSGTVTMMFTDIAGSTALLKDLGPAYPEALAEHRRVLRAIFERRNGIEVDTQGDAFFVVFERASDALAAAQDAQQELRGPVRVRIGVHTGEPLMTGDGYVGLDVHVAPGSARPVTAGRCSSPRPPASWWGQRASATSAAIGSRTSARCGCTRSVTMSSPSSRRSIAPICPAGRHLGWARL